MVLYTITVKKNDGHFLYPVIPSHPISSTNNTFSRFQKGRFHLRILKQLKGKTVKWAPFGSAYVNSLRGINVAFNQPFLYAAPILLVFGFQASPPRLLLPPSQLSF